MLPYARHRPAPPVDELRQPLDVASRAPGRAASCPTPAGPTTVTSAGRPSGLHPPEASASGPASSSSRPTSVACIPSSGRSPRCFARIRRAFHAGPARPCPSGRAAAAPGTRSPSFVGCVDARPDDDPARARRRTAGARRCSPRHRSASGRVGRSARSRSTSTSPASTPIRIASCGLPSVGEPPVQLRQHRLHLERRPDRSLGVVLVGARDAEHREHRVAHELLQQPFVAARSPRPAGRTSGRPPTCTTSGSSRSARVVDPTRSAKSAVANLRSMRARLGRPRAARRSAGRTSRSPGSPRRSGHRSASRPSVGHVR